MYRICLCEDNQIQAEIIKDMLSEYKYKDSIICNYHFNAADLLKSIDAGNSYDIYLLDLLMPGCSGMELAKKLRANNDNGIIIFITSSSDFAVESYDVNAFYYMLKPVIRDKFYEILDNAINTLKSSENIINIKTSSGIKNIEPHNICYITNVNRCLVFHLHNNSTIASLTIRKSFSESVEELNLTDSFIMCGAGLIINTALIDVVGNNSVIFKNGMLVYPSKSGLKSLKDIMTKGK